MLTDTNFIGKNIDDVIPILMDNGISFRRVKIDGNPSIVTCDYKPNRYNFEIENKIITRVYFG